MPIPKNRTLQTLDTILTYLNNMGADYEPIEQIRIGMDFKHLPNFHKGLQKLMKDEYVKKEEFVVYEAPEASFVGYGITFDGRVFIQQGGYVQQKRRQDLELSRTKVLNYTIAISGGVAAVYYLFELFRIWILPHLECKG